MHEYSVQFRLSGKELDPRQITEAIGLQPNQIRIAGDKRSELDSWSESLWSYDGISDGRFKKREWQTLEDGLSALLDVLEARMDRLSPFIARFDAVWWCGHFQSSFDGGPTISAKMLRRLGDFGVSIYIDNYLSEP